MSSFVRPFAIEIGSYLIYRVSANSLGRPHKRLKPQAEWALPIGRAAAPGARAEEGPSKGRPESRPRARKAQALPEPLLPSPGSPKEEEAPRSRARCFGLAARRE